MISKKIFLVILACAAVLSNCSNKKSNYNPDDCLTQEKQQALLQVMVRYASKLPPEATHETKFNPEFNWYYDRAVEESKILYCFLETSDSTYKLLVARQARSVTPMEEGIALRIKFDHSGGFEAYDEVFRMWKMQADTLRNRGKFLFDKMVKGEDLSLYYSRFQQDRFIEFPNDRFTFDLEKRRWRDAELDTLILE